MTAPGATSPAPLIHGLRTTYTKRGCRCARCRQEMARYQAMRELEQSRGIFRTEDITATRRRIQALMAIGWTGATLAEQLGWNHPEQVQKVLRQRFVFRRTAIEIARLYDRLWRIPGPSDHNRRLAARKGWLPPLWWDDDRIGDPAYDPRKELPARLGHQNQQALRENTRWLLDGGLSVELAAERLAVTPDYLRNLLAGTKGARRRAA